MKIKTKLITTCLTVGLTPLLILSILSIRTTSEELKKQALNTVKSISDHKRTAIETYFDTCESQTKILSTNNAIVTNLFSMNIFCKRIIAENGYSEEKLNQMKRDLRGYYTNYFGEKYKKENGIPPNIDKLFASLDNIGLAMQYLYIAQNPHPLESKAQLINSNDPSKYSVYHQKIQPLFKNTYKNTAMKIYF